MDLKEQIKLSDIALNNKDFIKAITLLEEALEIYPNNFELNFKLGLVYNVLGKLNESINYYQKSVSINPNFSPAYCNLGIRQNLLNLIIGRSPSKDSSSTLDENLRRGRHLYQSPTTIC